MGKSKPVIGYRYFMGQHHIPCQKADALLAIRLNEEEAWSGVETGGAINVDEPGLFGGENRGGGIVGTFRFLRGLSTQTAPSYFTGVLEAPVPAFRGVVSIIWEKIYQGTSPFPPRPAYLLRNTSALYDNWRSDVAVITSDGWDDLNPAHIIREVLLDPDNGGSDDPTEIGATFEDFADLCFAEGFGLSILDETPSDSQSVIRTVERHIDAKLFHDRVTGQWEIKPIRDDYDAANLFTFNKNDISEWDELPDMPRESELVNQLTLRYTKRSDGSQAAITMSNTALIASTGRVIAETVDYPGITNPVIAGRVLQRELLARSRPVRTAAFYAPFAPTDLNIGSEFIVNDDRVGLEGVVARVTSVGEPSNLDSRYLIQWAEDRFALNTSLEGFVTVDDEITPTTGALPMVNEFAIETPYWVAVTSEGQATIDGYLDDDLDAGTFIASGAKPDGRHVNVTVAVDQGSGFNTAAGESNFTPYAVISADVGKYDTTITCDYNSTIDTLEVDDLILVGTEFMRLDNVSTVSTTSTLTVGRGCLDTVPQAHSIGDIAYSIVPFARGDDDVYTLAESIDVKLLPATSGSQLSLVSAATQNVVFDSRAIRPYPVGNFRVDGVFEPVGLQTGNVTLTWAHRDRTQQTTTSIEDHTESNIGPEASVDYFLVRRWIQADGTVDYTETGASLGQVTTTMVDVDDAAFLANSLDTSVRLEVGIETQRSTYANWQTPFTNFEVLLSPVSLNGAGGSSANLTWTTRSPGADEIRVYRDTSTFDENSLPAILATLGAGAESYIDSPADGTYFYGVASVVGGTVALSNVVQVTVNSAARPTDIKDGGSASSRPTDISDGGTASSRPTDISDGGGSG